MDKYEKAEKLYYSGAVIFRGYKNQKLHFIVKGKKERCYEVTRDCRGKPKYHCPCDYFLPDHCSHIIACEIYVGLNGLLDKIKESEDNEKGNATGNQRVRDETKVQDTTSKI